MKILSANILNPKHVKVKLSLCLIKNHAMKTYVYGSRSIAPCILNLGARWRWFMGFTPQPLYFCGERSSSTYSIAGWFPEQDTWKREQSLDL
jgi:hypothetical protein